MEELFQFVINFINLHLSVLFMKISKFILIICAGVVLSLGASEAKKAIEKRIAPVGSVCVQGQDLSLIHI